MKKDFKFSELEYIRPDFQGFQVTLEDATKRIQEAASYEEMKKAMLDTLDKSGELEMMCTIASIRNTLNTTDEFYEKEVEFINETAPTVMEANMNMNKAILASPYVKELEQEYGKQLLVGMQQEIDSFNPELVPYLQREGALTTQYQKLMATAKIPFEGETLNLYGIQKHFEDADREKRKKAFKAYSDFYHDNEEEMEEIFGELIDIRNKMGRCLGDENYIPLGYKLQGRTDYGQEEVARFREQVRTEIVPLCEELYKAQAKRIGVDKIKAFDEKFIYPDGNAEPLGDDDFLIARAKEMYHDISKETGEFIDFMIEHELMDLKNKPNKASTGYMTYLPPLKAPFVFSCFNHTIFDMQVLSHELGHAFAGYQAMRHQPIANYYSESTDIAEIHSMAMEQFAYPYAEKFFGEDADKYRFAHLQEAITFVPFGVAVDEFQHIMYANPNLTPKERTYEWHKLEQKYMPWRTYEDDEFMERGGYWYHKLHIFLYPFYYINYTLTTMGAMELKKRYAQNKEEAWEDYMKLCNVGGSLSYLETLKNSHLSIPFEEGSVKNAISYAKEILLEQIKEQ
ncbi:M3 family oligoendopeptidase [Anaerosporobacter faecicola]|uniref:M3 family oligoendopeptidase n=1 Tax=Anaerosporobacter faecicola TaxID=2718714 RepID=UPI00143C0335|nr:M3 family oligoendopeptidase [Anaerosporobacter faecicola]